MVQIVQAVGLGQLPAGGPLETETHLLPRSSSRDHVMVSRQPLVAWHALKKKIILEPPAYG